MRMDKMILVGLAAIVSCVLADVSTVEQVLEKFKSERENLKSVITKSHVVTKYRIPGTEGLRINYKDVEFRFDGERFKTTQMIWGDIGSVQRGVKKEDAEYFSTMWDGQTAYVLSRGRNRGREVSGMTLVQEEHATEERVRRYRQMYKGTSAGKVMGYIRGDFIPIYELFLQPGATVKLRKRTSNVCGVNCLVLEADVPGHGQYTVWIDPVHDYHIARADVSRQAGDRMVYSTLKPDCMVGLTYKVLEFQRVGEAWFPRKCFITNRNKSRDSYDAYEREITLTAVMFGLDHELLGSFNTDYIPDGTRVKKSHLPIDVYEWRDGKALFVGREGKDTPERHTGGRAKSSLSGQ